MKISFKSNVHSFFVLIMGVFVLICGLSQKAFAEGTFITVPDRVDMVHDSKRNILYITGNGAVLRYNLNTNTFLTPFRLGLHLQGIDISPDNNILAVADKNLFGIHLIDLENGQIKKATYKPSTGDNRGSFSVAFDSNHSLLITPYSSGQAHIRKYDITKKSFTDLEDEISGKAKLKASANNGVIAFAESSGSYFDQGGFGRYRTADGTILHMTGSEEGTSSDNYDIGVNHNGSQYAITTSSVTYLADMDLTKFAMIGESYNNEAPTSVAYNPVKDILYLPWASTSQIYAYDTNTLQQVASYDFESTFPAPSSEYEIGRIKISKDGKYLFVNVQDGIRYLDLNLAEKNTFKKIELTGPQFRRIKQQTKPSLLKTASQ